MRTREFRAPCVSVEVAIVFPELISDEGLITMQSSLIRWSLFIDAIIADAVIANVIITTDHCLHILPVFAAGIARAHPCGQMESPLT
jgi:hypothetical protein